MRLNWDRGIILLKKKIKKKKLAPDIFFILVFEMFISSKYKIRYMFYCGSASRSAEELSLFAVGTYQIKLAPCYYSLHIRNTNTFAIQKYNSTISNSHCHCCYQLITYVN